MRFSASWEGRLVPDTTPAAAAAGGGEQNGNHDDDKDSTGDENPLHGDLLWSDGVVLHPVQTPLNAYSFPAHGKRLGVRGVLDSWEQ
jgi:hypothetical protein